MISKSGFSKQGGYEIYIEDLGSGLVLYDQLMVAGKEFNIKPGCPNSIERIEGAFFHMVTIWIIMIILSNVVLINMFV